MMRNFKPALALSLSAFMFSISPNALMAQDTDSVTIPPAIETPTEPMPSVQMIPATFADLAARLTPMVVNISSTQKITTPEDYPEMPQFPEDSPFKDFFDEFMDRRGGGEPIEPANSMGSGFIIDAQNGYVVTNNHVIRDSEKIQVILADDTTLPAELIGTDEKTDIAVLKVNPKDVPLTAATFGDSDKIRVGDWIMAIGNPFGLGGTVTTGIVSARARDINSGPYDDYLQTDASINRGNSGGPLFGMNGEVIGINTAIFSPSGGSVGIGFAIPSAQAAPVVKQIIKYGHTRRGWIGVRVQSVTDEIAESLGLEKARGALVAALTKEGPAEKGGIKVGDIILEFNDQNVHDMKFLPRYAADADIDSDAKVKLWRDGKEVKLNIKVGELEKAEDEGLLGDKDDAAKSGEKGITIDSVGISLIPMDDALRQEYGITPDAQGVIISEVLEKSEAHAKNLVEGDVIVELNQQPIKTPEEAADIIKKAEENGRKSVLALINSKGDTRFVALMLSK